MNKVELMGRLTRNPDIRYYDTQEGAQTCVARYTLAVDRRMARRDQEGQQTADFISCIEEPESLRRNICSRGQKSPLLEESRQEATRTRTAKRFIQRTLLSRSKSSQRAKAADRISSRGSSQSRADQDRTRDSRAEHTARTTPAGLWIYLPDLRISCRSVKKETGKDG